MGEVIAEHNRPALQQVNDCIGSRHNGLLLGPRYSGKTKLLHYIRDELAIDRLPRCVYLDLTDVPHGSQSAFFQNMTEHVVMQLEVAVGHKPPVASAVTSSGGFRQLLSDVLTWLDDDLVLMLDHLETPPADVSNELLRSLRKLDQEHSPDEYPRRPRLIILVASALSLAARSVLPTSPFQGIAKPIYMGALSEQACTALIVAQAQKAGVQLLPAAQARLILEAGGNAHLVRTLTRRCAEAAAHGATRQITMRTVGMEVRRFIDREAYHYEPLAEAIHLIEEDPDLLECVLKLLHADTVPMRELPLPLSPDLDPLYLTGLVRRVGSDSYQLLNNIYRSILERHFSPGHVGRLLTMAGRWDRAIDYLEESVKAGDAGYATSLLEATLSAIYASDDLNLASAYLSRALASVFGATASRIWLLSGERDGLVLAHTTAFAAGQTVETHISAKADRLEALVLRDGHPLRTQEGADAVRAMPLVAPGERTVGVVTIEGGVVGEGQLRQHDLELRSYLGRAARALSGLMRRRTQADTLRDISVTIGSSLDLPQVLGRILDEIGRVLPYDSASIQLLDPRRTALRIVEARGFENRDALASLNFSLHGAYPNVKVWHDQKPLRIANVREHYPHFVEPRYQAAKARGWLGVPLVVGDESLGVITLDSYVADAYTIEHESLAVLIASQAAVAIYRAQVLEHERQEKMLVQAIAKMTSSLYDRRATLQLILEGAMDLTGAETGNIALVDDGTGMITSYYSVGVPEGREPRELPVGDSSMQGWVAKHKCCALSDDVHSDEMWRDIYLESLPDTTSGLVVPIFRASSDRVEGIINLESPRQAAFQEWHKKLLEDLAVHADVAIESARTIDQLRRANTVAVMGAWGADVVHDINREVGNIRRKVVRIRQKHQIVPAVERLLADIEDSAQILELPELPGEWISRGRVAQTAARSEVDQVVGAELARFKARFPQIHMSCEMEGTSVAAAIHRQWLGRLLRHLVNNAVNSMTDDNREGLIVIRTRLDGGTVEIQVEDTGKGIRPEIRDELFERPIQHDDGKPGRGLLLVRFLAELHGGRAGLLWSEVNKGSCFSLILPVAP